MLSKRQHVIVIIVIVIKKLTGTHISKYIINQSPHKRNIKSQNPESAALFASFQRIV